MEIIFKNLIRFQFFLFFILFSESILVELYNPKFIELSNLSLINETNNPLSNVIIPGAQSGFLPGIISNLNNKEGLYSDTMSIIEWLMFLLTLYFIINLYFLIKYKFFAKILFIPLCITALLLEVMLLEDMYNIYAESLLINIIDILIDYNNGMLIALMFFTELKYKFKKSKIH
jgi:hypothetical protein